MGMKIIVAAADSGAQDKAKADFVCSGNRQLYRLPLLHHARESL